MRELVAVRLPATVDGARSGETCSITVEPRMTQGRLPPSTERAVLAVYAVCWLYRRLDGCA